ncbi:hypothetical protein TVAG_081770 [Trichomonas vaginalis G3]|uniref:Uncharacterized protein n=1 Tax=Trichomonas vaginalis (strain ATCC PRA-98 / G3) TaxID=412133 RepID=A2E6W9_TRIV3|nr:hypothetical protein TVAGG3_0492980 [Trichomonas vaginalis G3]EAY11605.1 hypothetical protein TVAG_081770 [Trichomonas vaginalis G3]KAI5516512.1 hypothetical protein TVAGG3_0492980 [Trichomonas vaginalis G3]|eukprot:XP_001323828.1 hypothetical protein [Trichomonas vaginalis G3]
MAAETSQAAVSAIAALQKRLRELEDEQKNLQSQIEQYNKHWSFNNEEFERREKSVAEITAKAYKMTQENAHVLVQIQEERKRKLELKNQILDLQDEIDECGDLEQSTRVKKGSVKQVSINYNKILDDYETLLALLFEPPQLVGRKHDFKMCKSDYDIDLLPTTMRRIAQQLEALPDNYKSQNLPTKRAIIQGLVYSREETRKLKEKIYALEKKRNTSTTPRSLTFEINKYIQQFNILSGEMKRFKF